MTTIIVKEGAMVADVRQRMIQQATLSLAKKGLQRTSFSEVLEASGAPRGSLYHHFPGGKDELVLGALDLAGDFAVQALAHSRGRSAKEVAEAFIALWRSILGGSDFAAGCAVVAVTVAADSPAQLESAAAVFREWRARLDALLAEGGLPAHRAGALAATLIAGCEGAVVLSRAERSFEPFDLVAAELLAAVETAMAAR